MAVLQTLAQFQEALEKIPGVKKTGEFLRTQFEKSQAAQEQFFDLQRELSRPLYEGKLGRALTDDEFKKIPVVDPIGAIGAVGEVGKLTARQVARLGRTPVGDVKAFVEAGKNFLVSTGKRIEKLGEAGKTLAGKITRAADIGEVTAGKRVAPILESGLQKLSKEEKFNLLDVLEGRARPSSVNVERVAEASRKSFGEVAAEAQEIGVRSKIKRTIGPEDVAKEGLPTGLTPFQRQQLEAGKRVSVTMERPFTPRRDFFPHIIPQVDQLRGGEVRSNIIANLVRLKVRPNEAEAGKFLDDFIDFLDNGKLSGRRQSVINYMVETGQAKNEAEALANLQRFRQRTIKRQGSLEFARQVDLPFYDPDPLRVIPQSITSQSKRLSEIRTFGQANQEINKLISKIRTQSGEVDADFARKAVDRILGIVNEGNTAAAKASRFLRTLQGFRLGLASIPNMTQGFINTLIAGDLKAVAAGVRGILTKQGRSLALRSGATLESTINEALREAGATGKALGTFLKATGFTATERLNRVFAANGGASLARRATETLLKNPKSKGARKFLADLGFNVDEVLKRGALTDDDILMAAKKFTDMTQFRARPQDLPFFASTPEGKVFFQFKNFIYGQTRLLNRVIIEEFKSGNYGRGVRNLLILSTVFPLTGAAINGVRSIITGRKRDEEGLEAYFDNVAAVGAMGIFSDMLESSKFGTSLVESFVGPTLSEAGRLADIGAGILRGEKGAGKRLVKEAVGRIPLLGQILKPRLFPSTAKSKNPFEIK